jgi:hypothetical protein
MMDAAELEIPQSDVRVLSTALLCKGVAGRLPAATPDLPFLDTSPPRTFDARPWIAVHEPPKESSRDDSFLGRDFFGLSAGLVREGYLLGIAGEPDREPNGESRGEASRALGLIEKSSSSSSELDINLAVRGRRVEVEAGVELVLEEGSEALVGFMAVDATTAN